VVLWFWFVVDAAVVCRTGGIQGRFDAPGNTGKKEGKQLVKYFYF
jgi:hypothetical protein